jgi:DNA-directed RNA polymerase subunit K/omega
MAKLTPAQMKKAVEEFKKKFTGGFLHASPSPSIKKFDPSKGDRAMPTEGVTFVTRDPDFADSFLDMHRKGKTSGASDWEYDKGSTVYPLSVNLGKHFVPGSPEGKVAISEFVKNLPADPDAVMSAAKRAELLQSGAWDVMEDPRFLQYLRDTGHDTFTVMEGGVPNVGIFDPKNIRGKFAKFNPEDAESADFMKAKGGSVQHFQSGGKVGNILSILKKLGLSEESIAAWKAANGINQRQVRNPLLQQAAKDLAEGKITSEQYRALARTEMPINPFTNAPNMPSQHDIANALKSNQLETGIIGVNKEIAPGSRVSSRLDIPAYDKYDKWIVSLHDPLDAGKSIGYGQTAHLKGPIDFTAPAKAGHAIATGKSDKTTYARIHGDWEPTDPEDVYKRAQDLMGDPQWAQVGLNPFRHSYFYDKADMAPVVGGQEALQVGPLVLVKKPQKVDPDDPRFRLSKDKPETFAAGGAIKAAKRALEHAKSVPFVHYSKAPNISTLDPNRYGTGIKGAEAGRLKSAPDIRPRTFFYTKAGGRQPEQGLGPHKYEGVAEDIYPLHDDPMGFSAIAKERAIDPYMMQFGREVVDEATHLNELERLIKKAGYKGYANDDVGLLFDPTPVIKAE